MAPLPSRIGKYELVRRLGQGGMGSVYLARDPDLDRFVAIKVLREQLFDDELLQRFFREARAAANLRHDNIITIYDVGQHDHQPFMALEYVDGQTLLDIIRARSPLPLAEKLSFIEQICAGLHFAHGAGLVHRDIKPANVMVDKRGVIRILDFGIARVEGSGMTGDGAMIGTLNYMSPEQMLGRPVDFRSDIFAIGTLAYELITYNRAFPGALDDGLLQKLPYEDPPALSTFCDGLPEGLEAAVFRALAKKPEDRFTDLEHMRLAVRDVRRELDPQLALETIVVTARRGPGGRSSTSGRSEHPEFAERRARQIAVHLEAARDALARQDIEGAKAACEDALTLAPDNADALGLLEQAERARQLRDEESRARRERERSVRQRIADADLKLARGDVESAVRTLEHALLIDPDNAAGLAMLPRVREAAETAGVQLPSTLSVADGRSLRAAAADAAPLAAATVAAASMPDAIAPTVLASRPAHAGEPGPDAKDRPRRTALVAAAAAVIVLAAAGIAWIISPGNADRGAVAEEPVPSAASSAGAGAGPVAPPANESSAGPGASAETAPAVVQAPGAAPPPPAPAPDAALTSAPPPRPEPGADPALQRRIADVTATYRRGDLAAALNGIEPLVDTSDDPQVRQLAATLAQAAARSMTAAATAADVLRAAERAPQTYAAAERVKDRVDQALAKNRYVEAGRTALSAAAGYRQAEREAALAAAAPPAAPRIEPEARAAASPASAGNIAPSAPAPAGGAASPISGGPAPPPAAALPPAAAAATAPVITRDDDGILAMLGRYQDAYRELSIDKLLAVYPRLPRERQQNLRDEWKGFKQCDVQFLNPSVQYAPDDPSTASLTARFTYSCQPRTRQPAQSYSVDEFFQVRKLGERWMIQNTAVLDDGRR